MIKGQSYGLCYNCWHYKYQNNRNCRKYDFVFPKSSFDIFCGDYRRDFLKRLVTDPRTMIFTLIMGVPLLLLYIFTGGWFYDCKSVRWRKRLMSSTLYYYQDQSKRPLQPLATFSELQSQTYLKSVSVKIDSEYGFFIQFDSDALADIPDIGKDMEIDIDDKKIKFGVRGGFNALYCLEPKRLTSWVDRTSAIFFAQPESKTYKLLPHYFR